MEKKKKMEETGFDPRGKSLWLSIMNPSLTPAPAGNVELYADSTPTLETLTESVPDFSEDTQQGLWSGTVLETQDSVFLPVSLPVLLDAFMQQSGGLMSSVTPCMSQLFNDTQIKVPPTELILPPDSRF